MSKHCKSQYKMESFPVDRPDRLFATRKLLRGNAPASLAILFAAFLLSGCGGRDTTSSATKLLAASDVPTWDKIASENQTFNLGTASLVRYGADTRWIQKIVSGTFTCSNTLFGSDPAPTVVKECQIQNAPSALTFWLKIAGENGPFNLATSTNVRYGADTRWLQKTINGAATCSNAQFGSDPAAGTYKECQVQKMWVKIASENETVNIPTASIVRFGSDTRWVEKTLVGAVTCSLGQFGSDPAPAVYKECQLQSAPVNQPTTPTPPPPPPPTPNNSLMLPLEVLSDGSPLTPAIAEANLTVDSAKLSSVTQLWFSCHRCGFFGAPEFEATSQPATKIKASMRILGGVDPSQAANIPWVDITDANVQLADAERVQGGLSRGGLYTTRMSLVFDAATKARLVAAPLNNRIQFRFNGTDGESNGYRILSLQLQDTQGTSLANNAIQYADIKTEKDAGKVFSADVSAGQALWSGRGKLLKSTIVPRQIQAACASCHAVDGHDLQYFNYSNNAIVQRSRFHGLSEAQGKQIVAYLRYSLKDEPHVAQAAPWNPPYQPGIGIDSKPIKEWAAGAGLSAVLDTPARAVNALFNKPLDGQPGNITQADVDAVMDAGATMNTREIALPLQYPDWNAWLPTIHPLDVWPTTTAAPGSFETGAQFSQSRRTDPNALFNQIEAWLKAHKNPNGVFGDWSHLTPAERNEIQSYFFNFGWESYAFLGGGRGNHIASSGEYGAQVGGRNLSSRASNTTTSSEPEAATTNAFIERSVMSLLHWNVVRQWELAQKYGLEGNQKWFIGDYNATAKTWKGRGEARGWPFNTVSMFFLAPHMLYQADTVNGQTTREWIMAWEGKNKIGSYYRTNIWYQMQMTINPGGQGDWVNYSMDWPYLTGFDELLAGTLGNATPANENAAFMSNIRLLQGRIKGAQFVNNDIPLYVSTDTGNLINNRGRFGRAQAMKHLTPVNFMDRATTQGNGGNPYTQLNQLAPGLHLKIVNGAIKQFNILYASTDPNNWRRCDPNNFDLGESEPTAGFAFCVDKNRTPLAQQGTGYAMNMFNGRSTPEQNQQYGIWKATQMGAEASRIKTWTDWTRRIWP